jgi:hypothetical protein
MDGRKIGDNDQVVFGIVPIIKNHSGVTQNPFFYIPILIVNDRESTELFQEVVDLVTPQMSREVDVGSEKWTIDWICVADLSSIWKATDMSWHSETGFCPWCNAHKKDCLSVSKQYIKRDSIEGLFGLAPTSIYFCTLHSILRITEKLIIWLLWKTKLLGTTRAVIRTIRIEAEWKNFCAIETNGVLRVGGWTNMHKITKLLEKRTEIINAAFGKLQLPEHEDLSQYDIKVINDDKEKEIEDKGQSKGKRKQKEKKQQNRSNKKKQTKPKAKKSKNQGILDSRMEKTVPETSNPSKDEVEEIDEEHLVEIDTMDVDEPEGVVTLLPNVFEDDETVPEFVEDQDLEAERLNWLRLFDCWTWISVNLDNKCVTNNVLERFQFVVGKFKHFLDQIVNVKGSSAYIHIICEHSYEMLQNTRGLWLYSQQGTC